MAGKLLVRQMAFTPEQVVAASAPGVSGRPSEHGGVYFLIWKGRIVYVGKASTIWARLNAHYREGRPHDAVAVISGLTPEIAATVEDCYVRAWDPPWNCGRTQGHHRDRDRLYTALRAMDRALVMPWHVPRGGAEMSRMKKWELHVLGHRQACA